MKMDIHAIFNFSSVAYVALWYWCFIMFYFRSFFDEVCNRQICCFDIYGQWSALHCRWSALHHFSASHSAFSYTWIPYLSRQEGRRQLGAGMEVRRGTADDVVEESWTLNSTGIVTLSFHSIISFANLHSFLKQSRIVCAHFWIGVLARRQ